MEFKNEKEIASYFAQNRHNRKHTDTEFYTLLHQSITRLMQGQKLPIYNVIGQSEQLPCDHLLKSRFN